MDKKELRNSIKTLKKQHTKEQLLEQSEVILSKLEQHPDFQKAHIVMIYSALPDEVQTEAFLEKWRHEKKIILPRWLATTLFLWNLLRTLALPSVTSIFWSLKTSLTLATTTSSSFQASLLIKKATASVAAEAITTGFYAST